MTESNIAKEIIESKEEPEEEEEEEEDQPSIEDEFRDLHGQSDEMIERMRALEKRFAKAPGTAATHADVSALYGFLSGDVLPYIRDVVSASGAAFNDTLEELANVSGSEDDDGEGDEDTIGEDEVQYYVTFQANLEAFVAMSQVPGIPAEQKVQLEQLVGMNQAALKTMHDKHGDELVEAARKTIEDARAEVQQEQG